MTVNEYQTVLARSAKGKALLELIQAAKDTLHDRGHISPSFQKRIENLSVQLEALALAAEHIGVTLDHIMDNSLRSVAEIEERAKQLDNEETHGN
jgi:hypothetical protein